MKRTYLLCVLLVGLTGLPASGAWMHGAISSRTGAELATSGDGRVLPDIAGYAEKVGVIESGPERTSIPEERTGGWKTAAGLAGLGLCHRLSRRRR